MTRNRIKIRRIWLPGILGRITLLLMSMSLLTLYFYLAGNAQGFTDSTLVILLNIESWILSFTAMAGACSTLSYLLTLPPHNRTQLPQIIFSVLATILSTALYIGVGLLQAFLDGYTL